MQSTFVRELEIPITEPNTLACKKVLQNQSIPLPFFEVPCPALPKNRSRLSLDERDCVSKACTNMGGFDTFDGFAALGRLAM